MEVVSGIHKVDGPWGGNVYLLADEDGLALVDAALPFNEGRILRYIERLGRKPTELRYIVLTHAHPDHTGNIPALAKRSDLRVLVHPNDSRKEADGRSWLYYPGQVPPLPWPLPWDVPLLRKIYADDLVEDGQSLPILGGMRVIHTPGHTQGSISLYLEKHGVLITGDMLLNNRGNFAKPFPFPGTDPEAYHRSLERLSRLQFDVACVGHGKPVVGGASEKLRRMLENYSWQSPWRRLARKLSPPR